ncbi:PstS family phosphate ABC transporter substrate-binding protein [Tahibacter soli]|uniref:PstS family phosphate ABC transporter substrate-binding protein n=1 Tax=Tahibacter soli TaxID=2983605 RepID=A0A9X3YHL3_9GAMM|nr:PstS family phosphate ABC transporter substrate-binding protein [Tahibacter soli]MDC8011762.1 PstS family phosphate ABC transporter substrate-binding protein [Tahibacter soli]
MRALAAGVALRAAALCVLLLCANASVAREAPALTSVGSDTLGNLMLRWMQAYRQTHPDLRIALQTPGSAGAPLALASGSADLGPMSRAMTDAERDAYRARRGGEPGRVRIALDAIAVFVHPDNPLATIDARQLDAIWSNGRRCGAVAAVEHWSDLAVGDTALAARPLLRTGRNTASGTFEFFRDRALCGGDYRADVVQFPGSGAIVAAVASQPHAIGNAGFGYVNGLVKTLAIAASPDGPAVLPTPETVASGRYPLSRPLYLYFNRGADGKAQAAAAGFLRFALSDEAQAMVAQQGFVALPPAELAAQRNLVE